MDERSRRVDSYFNTPLIVAALLTIPATIIEGSHPARPWPQIATGLNWAIWGAFFAELVVMLALVPDRRWWLRHHLLDVLIVVLTPPILLSALQPLRLLRLLRLGRLLRLAPLIRFLLSEQGLRYIAMLALLTALVGGTAFADAENISIGNGIYWAVQTMTTVGYGDIVPHTAEGKVIAVVVMLIGIGSATLVIGAVAQHLAGVGERGGPGADDGPGAGGGSGTGREPAAAELSAQVEEIASALRELQAAIARRERSGGSAQNS